MSDILSQSEIDNLLKQLSEGDLDVDQIQGEDEKQVKNYDFSRPTKFSKEHLRTLEIIFEHYSRLISTNLPVYLRKNVQVSVASSETVTFSEFSNALSNPSVLGIVNFAPLNGNIIIEIATNLCHAGSYAGRQRPAIGKEQRFFRYRVDNLTEAFGHVYAADA